MPSGYLTRSRVRELDRVAIEEYGVPGTVLMENAGRGAAGVLMALGIHGRVAICCGKGNNGGDGFVIARHLANHGVAVRVLLFARPGELSGDAGIHFRILEKSSIPISSPMPMEELGEELRRAEWTVDALFGTGLAGPVRPPFDKVIEAINTHARRVLAVDIPSGLDADTGQAPGATVRARHTVTFVAPKTGFAQPAARQWLGKVHVLDIGMGQS